MVSDSVLEKRQLPFLLRIDDLNVYISSVLAAGINKNHNEKEYSEDIKKIKDKIHKILLQDIDDLYALLFGIALSMYKDSYKYFIHNKVDYVKMPDNKPVMGIINTAFSDLVNKHTDRMNLDNMVIKPKNGNFVKVKHWYRTALNTVNNSNTPEDDTYRKLFILTDSGVKEKQSSGNTSRLDTSFENDINNCIKDMSQEIQIELGKQFGSDGVELSVHAFPAPDHAPVQGHVFYNDEYDKLQNGEDFQDVDGNQFTGFERAIGMWNCRHFAFSIVVGVHPRNYTQKQLDEILANNEKGYIYNGKHFTMYECTQMQRRYEREIRKAKDGYLVAKAANNKELLDRYQSKVRQYTEGYKTFSKGCGLQVKHRNIYVEGYE